MSHDPPAVKDSDVEIRVYATVRSGHHGFIEWLIPHFKGEILFRHNISRVDWPAGPYVSTLYNVWEKHWKRELYIMNVEDADLSTVRTNLVENRWHNLNGVSKSVKEILVVRDPYNCFASAYRALGPFPFQARAFPEGMDLYVKRGSLIPIWKQHAREYLDNKFLPGCLIVNFNTWMTNEKYRVTIARALGLEFTDAGFGKRGMSSSFDGRFQNARDLRLFDRWRVFEADPTFKSFFDDEIHDLAAEIWGEPMKELRETFS